MRGAGREAGAAGATRHPRPCWPGGARPPPPTSRSAARGARPPPRGLSRWPVLPRPVPSPHAPPSERSRTFPRNDKLLWAARLYSSPG